MGLPSLPEKTHLAVGTARGHDGCRPPDQRLGAGLNAPMTHGSIPERELDEEGSKAHREADEVPRRRQDEQQNERNNEEQATKPTEAAGIEPDRQRRLCQRRRDQTERSRTRTMPK
jgi:hypothetical protein